MPELLNAGRSEAGFSRVGQAMLCNQLYAYVELLEVDGLGNRDPLHRGSLVHTGEAHYWERLRRTQQLGAAVAGGMTVEQARAAHPLPEELYDPVAAIHAHAKVMRAEGIPVKDEIEAVSAHAMSDLVMEHELVKNKPLVVSVEREYRALLDADPLQGQSAEPEIRVYREDEVRAALQARGLELVNDPKVPFLRHVVPFRICHEADDIMGCARYMREQQPSTWIKDLNGYKGPQAFYLYTQRIDLITWEPTGVAGPDGQPVYALVVADHKTTNHYKTGEYGTVRAYSMHGQFWGLRLLTQLYYPDLAAKGLVKLRINVIQMPGPKNKTTWIQEPPEPAPWRESRHWRNVWDTYRQLHTLIESGRDPWDFPATGHEMACMLKRYGRCEAWELCQRGRAAVAGVKVKSMTLGAGKAGLTAEERAAAAVPPLTLNFGGDDA